jgi:hypothetical protein
MKYYVFGVSGSCNDGDHLVDFEEFNTLDEAKQHIQTAKQDNFDYAWQIIHGRSLARGDDEGTEIHDPKFGPGGVGL